MATATNKLRETQETDYKEEKAKEIQGTVCVPPSVKSERRELLLSVDEFGSGKWLACFA